MSVAPRLMTWQEFLELPEDGQRYELIRGELITIAPPPHTDHGGYANNIAFALTAHVRQQRLGGRILAAETGILLQSDPDTVRAADVSYISAARWPKGGIGKGYFRGAPDFVVEVASDFDRISALEEKVDEWLAAGARLVWLVNPRRKAVTVYRPKQPPALFNDTQTLDAGDVVPGFTLPVAEIFVLD